MLNTRFGVEIEFTGITRKEAAQKAKKVLGERFVTSVHIMMHGALMHQTVELGSS